MTGLRVSGISLATMTLPLFTRAPGLRELNHVFSYTTSHGSQVSITRTVNINKPTRKLVYETGVFFFLAWSASVTLEIDGIQFKPEASSKEVKVSSSSRKCRLPRFNVIIERWYGRFPLLRLIAMNYAPRLP